MRLLKEGDQVSKRQSLFELAEELVRVGIGRGIWLGCTDKRQWELFRKEGREPSEMALPGRALMWFMEKYKDAAEKVKELKAEHFNHRIYK